MLALTLGPAPAQSLRQTQNAKALRQAVAALTGQPLELVFFSELFSVSTGARIILVFDGPENSAGNALSADDALDSLWGADNSPEPTAAARRLHGGDELAAPRARGLQLQLSNSSSLSVPDRDPASSDVVIVFNVAMNSIGSATSTAAALSSTIDAANGSPDSLRDLLGPALPTIADDLGWPYPGNFTVAVSAADVKVVMLKRKRISFTAYLLWLGSTINAALIGGVTAGAFVFLVCVCGGGLYWYVTRIRRTAKVAPSAVAKKPDDASEQSVEDPALDPVAIAYPRRGTKRSQVRPSVRVRTESDDDSASGTTRSTANEVSSMRTSVLPSHAHTGPSSDDDYDAASVPRGSRRSASVAPAPPDAVIVEKLGKAEAAARAAEAKMSAQDTRMIELERIIAGMQAARSSATVAPLPGAVGSPQAGRAPRTQQLRVEVVSSSTEGSATDGRYASDSSSSAESEDSAEREKMLRKARLRALNLLHSQAPLTKKGPLSSTALVGTGRAVLAKPLQGLGARAVGSKPAGLNLQAAARSQGGHVMGSRMAQSLQGGVAGKRGPGALAAASSAARRGVPPAKEAAADPGAAQ